MIDVSCERVSKQYAPRTAPWRARTPFWALRDLSFDVARGETLGVIGTNGAGKSTLLKLLARVTAPTSGRIVIRGRLSALIEVGSGFHPELSGRENVYLSGAILGMRRREIAATFDQIVEFSGVGPFIDMPVKWYSSGMYVRLGFSIAAHLNPDVLLIDEVLAVGDTAFQERCLARIRALRQSGTTAILISHDLAAVEALCDRVMLLEGGRVADTGEPHAVVRGYRHRIGARRDSPLTAAAAAAANMALTGLDLVGPDRAPVMQRRTGEPLGIRVTYRAASRSDSEVVEVFFYSADGQVLYFQLTTAFQAPLTVAAGRGTVEFHVDELPLQPGEYSVVASSLATGSQEIGSCLPAVPLTVHPGRMVRGHVYVPHRWHHRPAQETQ